MSASRASVRLGLLAELAVVFIGVLIALAADSWWEDREARVRLADSLEALAVDLEDARAALESAVSQDSAIVAITSERLAAIQAGSLDAEVESVAPELSIRVPPLPYGTLRFLVESGDVALVTDEATREALIQGLSVLERNDGINLELAAEARAASHAIRLAQNESQIGGRVWPHSIENDAQTITSVELFTGRIANIVSLLGSSLAAVEQMEAAVQRELGSG